MSRQLFAPRPRRRRSNRSAIIGEALEHRVLLTPFGSNHSGGVNFCMSDGSVRTVDASDDQIINSSATDGANYDWLVHLDRQLISP